MGTVDPAVPSIEELVDELATYHPRAEAIVEAIFALDPTAVQQAYDLDDEVMARFYEPLVARYEAIPLRRRAWNAKDDIGNIDAIGSLVRAFAGMAELGDVYTVADGSCEPIAPTSVRDAELTAAALRWYETFKKKDEAAAS